MLSAADIDSTVEGGVNSGVWLHIRAYELLRSLVRRHINISTPPFLAEIPRPEGGYEAVKATEASCKTSLRVTPSSYDAVRILKIN
jgi:hypothetical protein